MQQVECVVLGDVEQRGIATALDALVMADEVSLGDAGHEPVPMLR